MGDVGSDGREGTAEDEGGLNKGPSECTKTLSNKTFPNAFPIIARIVSVLGAATSLVGRGQVDVVDGGGIEGCSDTSVDRPLQRRPHLLHCSSARSVGVGTFPLPRCSSCRLFPLSSPSFPAQCRVHLHPLPSTRLCTTVTTLLTIQLPSSLPSMPPPTILPILLPI